MSRATTALLVGLAAGFLGGGFLSITRTSEAARRAEAAEELAGQLAMRVMEDSVASARLAAEHAALRVTEAARRDSLGKARADLREREREHRAERIAITARLDSIEKAIGDTARFVPRADFDLARRGLRIAEAEIAELRESLGAGEKRADSWMLQAKNAEAGWAVDREALRRAREALAVQIEATEQWRAAAKPSLGQRVIKDVKPFLAGAAAAVLLRQALAAQGGA